MCGLCGILGNDVHWTDASGLIEVDELAHIKRLQRQERITYLNPLLQRFSCSVSDWQGKAYLLRSFTGKTIIVDNLTALWTAVETLSGQRLDPLNLNIDKTPI